MADDAWMRADEGGRGGALGAAASGGPFTVRRYSRPGRNAYRILVLGDQSPRDGRPGFGQALVNRIWLRSQRGLNADVVASALTGLRSLHAAFTSWRVPRYDAVVVVLPPRGFRTQRRAARALASVLERLLENTSVTIASDDDELPAAAAGRQATGEIPDMNLSPEASAADLVAIHVGRQLQALVPGVGRRRSDTGGGSRTATTASASAESRIDLRLGSIATMAREGFGVATAAINILDGDDLWTIAAAGTKRGRRSREGTLCDETADRAGLTVIPDVWADPQLRMLPIAYGPLPIRFYAAYPIEPQRGQRIGTLCIYDPFPREPDAFDFTLLRDLAQLAEIEISEAGRLPRR